MSEKQSSETANDQCARISSVGFVTKNNTLSSFKNRIHNSCLFKVQINYVKKRWKSFIKLILISSFIPDKQPSLICNRREEKKLKNENMSGIWDGNIVRLALFFSV